LHFDISNLWLSNIQLRQSPKKNGSIVDYFVREKTKQKIKMRIKTSTNKKWQLFFFFLEHHAVCLAGLKETLVF